MLKTFLAFIINWIHYLIILIGTFGWAILPLDWLPFFMIFMVAIPIHWKMFDGCVVTKLERRLLNDDNPETDFIEYELNKVGLPLNKDFVKYLLVFGMGLSGSLAFLRWYLNKSTN
jgi:hypothetical protein